MGLTTGFINGETGVDIGTPLVEKSYLLDRYPELVDTFKQAGLWTWGRNTFGQLGDNSIVNKSSPVQTVSGGTNWKQVGVGSHFSVAIKTDGTLWTWGRNTFGQLGDNSIVNKSSPVQTISGGTNWKQVAVGDSQCVAIKTDGTLWTWGSNSFGCLGDNTTTSRNSPVQTIASGTNWKYAASGTEGSAAIKTDGTLWTWGANNLGQLGDGTTTSKSSPVQTISTGTNWKQVSCGFNSMAAIKTDGTLWLWGSGTFGQLGNGTTTSKSSPVQTISGGTNWKQVVSSSYLNAAIKTDGTLWTWGANSDGQLGDGTTTSKSSPVQTISTGTNWKQVSAGVGQVMTGAIKTDGTLWLWGNNAGGVGAVGDNSIISKSSPVQTIASGTNWKQVSVGYTSSAIRDDSSDIFGNSM